MVSVRLDTMLREFGPPSTLTASAATVSGLLDDLEGRYPRLRLKLRDETGALRRFVRVFVNGATIDPRQGLTRSLAPDDEVDILHSIQGG